MLSQRRLFLPGWGAPAALYRRGLPARWEALDPPSFRAGAGTLAHSVEWLDRIVVRADEPLVLAGHSMGGALAVVVAAARPERVARLVLISPAGLPLRKPMRASLASFAAQAARGTYPAAAVLEGIRNVAGAPRSALRLAREVRALDLVREMGLVRAAGIPTTVIGCVGDTLVPTDLCRRSAELLGASYRSVRLPDGHMWMLNGWRRLRHELQVCEPAAG